MSRNRSAANNIPPRYICRVCQVRPERRGQNSIVRQYSFSVPSDMAVHDMVEGVMEILADGDVDHLYSLKTPNHLQIFSAIDDAWHPVGMGDDEDEYRDYWDYCEEVLGYVEAWGQPRPAKDTAG